MSMPLDIPWRHAFWADQLGFTPPADGQILPNNPTDLGLDAATTTPASTWLRHDGTAPQYVLATWLDDIDGTGRPAVEFYGRAALSKSGVHESQVRTVVIVGKARGPGVSDNGFWDSSGLAQRDLIDFDDTPSLRMLWTGTSYTQPDDALHLYEFLIDMTPGAQIAYISVDNFIVTQNSHAHTSMSNTTIYLGEGPDGAGNENGSQIAFAGYIDRQLTQQERDDLYAWYQFHYQGVGDPPPATPRPGIGLGADDEWTPVVPPGAAWVYGTTEDATPPEHSYLQDGDIQVRIGADDSLAFKGRKDGSWVDLQGLQGSAVLEGDEQPAELEAGQFWWDPDDDPPVSQGPTVPGWVTALAVDGTEDATVSDEFDDDSLAAAWTLVEPSGTTDVVEAKGLLSMSSTSANTQDSADVAALLRAATLGDGDYAETSVAEIAHFLDAAPCYETFGLVLTDGVTASSKSLGHRMFTITSQLGAPWRLVTQVAEGTLTEYTTTWTSPQWNATWVTSRLGLRVKNNSGSYEFYLGILGGHQWMLLSSRTPGFTPTHIGLIHSLYSTTTQYRNGVVYEYFRVYRA